MTLALSKSTFLVRPVKLPSSRSVKLHKFSSAASIPRKLVRNSEAASLVVKSISGPTRNAELMERVHGYLTTSKDSATEMELIDTIQRLGLSHLFEEEIQSRMDISESAAASGAHDLFSIALRFRLLRQNGYAISSDVFKRFMDETNTRFLESLSSDTLGVLSLYEASCLGAKDETILIQARDFATTCLRRSLPLLSTSLRNEVTRGLALPRHLRMPRLEASNYIKEYKKKADCNTSLLEFAARDFDRVQMQHRDELTELKRWWKELGLVRKLGFGRDRPLECFLWSVGIFQEPCHGTCRIELSKVIAILLVIDDVYDTYGQYDDLVLFTDAIKRWDLAAITDLPDYMKICYMALYNTTNDIAFKILKEHGTIAVSYLRESWMKVIESFMVEVEWMRAGYVATSEEHLSNAVHSGGTLMVLVHAFFMIGEGVTAETMEMMHTPYPDVFSIAGKILRLWDDLGTSKEEQEKGEVASSIQCYMKELNMTEDEASEHIKLRISNLWVELNGALVAPKTLPFAIINASLNVARTAQVIHQHGDDNTLPDVKEQVETLLFTPV